MRNSDQVSTNVSNSGGIDKKHRGGWSVSEDPDEFLIPKVAEQEEPWGGTVFLCLLDMGYG